MLIVLLGLAGESDNDIRRDRHAGPRGTNALGELLEFLRRVAPAHDFQNAVGAALEWQMHMLYELG